MPELSQRDLPDGLKKEGLLSFKPTGRPLTLHEVYGEFMLMRVALDKPLTAAIAANITEKSGSHLLKLVSPRVDGDHAVLRINQPNSNSKASILPSVNASEIPFCKVVFRPLELAGNGPMSVVDHILNPVDCSAVVLADFGRAFGEDVLSALRTGLLSPGKVPLKLGAGEFPIVFAPRPGGGDLQITPVSPVSAFMGIKRVADAYFLPVTADTPRPPRGRWVKQVISTKPQNISGAIGGPRLRFLATMPSVLQQAEAELHRYVQGGAFPRWRDEAVGDWVLRYGEMLEAHDIFNNSDTRAALDRTADRLIRDAQAFINETMIEAGLIAPDKMLMPAQVAQILIRRRWIRDGQNRAVKALSSPHFEDRLRKCGAGEGAAE